MADSEISDTPRALSSLPAGMRCVIDSLPGERSLGSRRRPGLHGRRTGQRAQNDGRGPTIVALRGTLVALGRAEAAKVLVQMES